MFREEALALARFLKRWSRPLVLALLFTLAAYAFMLTHDSLTIDEETWRTNTAGSFAWLTQGRPGIYLLNLLLSPRGGYVPILWDWLAVPLYFAGAPLLLFSLRRRLPEYGAFTVFAFCAYFGTVPLCVGEILSYSMFNLQIGVAMLCAALSCALSEPALRTGRYGSLLPAVLLLAFAVSVYQAFVGVYLTWAAGCQLLDALAGKRFRPALREYAYMAAVACAAALLYAGAWALISRFVVRGSGYLAENYVGWGGGPALLTLLLSVANVGRVWLGVTVYGQSVYGGVALAVTSLAFLAVMLRLAFAQRRFLRYALSAALLFASPFLLSIALGTYRTPGRMLVSLSFAGALMWLVALAAPGKLPFRRAAAALCALTLCYNLYAMNRLFYDAWRVYEFDRQTATRIVAEMERQGLDYTVRPVVFIGMCDTHPGVELERSGSCGASFFSWDDGNIARMLSFFRVEGYAVRGPSTAQIVGALKTAEQMPQWPQPGSVRATEENIVVNLSPPTEKWSRVNGAG